MLKTKSIYAPPEGSDGLRVSIMSRHTQNDGKTPDPLILPDTYDLHLPRLAPPPNLIGDYYRRGLSWKAFEKRYNAYIGTPPVEALIRQVGDWALDKNVTLMCKEDFHDDCHRGLLIVRFSELIPELETSVA